MKIIKKRNILTKEDEISLLNIVKDEKSSAAEKSKAEETLVLRNMGLVVKEARRWATNGSIPMEDLVQEGAKGLVRAIQKFDINSGNKFSTYATWWVKRDIGRIVRTGSDVIHVPEHISEAARIAKTAISKFESENGRKPTIEEFEKISGMSSDKAEEAFKAIQKTASIHTPVGDENGSELGDLIEDQKAEEPYSNMVRSEGMSILSKCMDKLSSTERTVLAVRYGTVSEPMKIEDLAKEFNIPVAELA